ncbi:MAG TPA: TetR family transcriptional regulator [Solirubrobacteraceae bacterium]|nr:TetR family transcriptional regulator [Solirubrobacteraceae bacterium]
MTEIQRGRMLAAAVEAVEDLGYARMTVAQVISRAKVSRKTFYDVFVDREDCFVAAFDRAVAYMGGLVSEAYEREAKWQDAIRAGLLALLVFLEDEPGLARLCVVEALGAGPKALERRAEVLDVAIKAVDRGRAEVAKGKEPPPLTAEGVVGAVFSVVHTRLLERSPIGTVTGSQAEPVAPLTDLLGSLMSMIVLPFLGGRAASRELSRPAPDLTHGSAGTERRRDPLEGLDMRLTYRTMRVLTVIAEHPGASNREVAEGSGIADQGQISKLLNRLERLSLIENTGEGQVRGASNAWHLTEQGAHVERAVRPL